jgi:hypothetical protein
MATSVVQELLRDLQLNPELQGDETLQRIARSLQTELYAFNQRPQPKAAAPPNLTPEQQDTWDQFQIFHQLLCDYSGYVNRDQWLHLVDVSADLLTRGPQGDSPYIGSNGNWWIGDTDTGVPAEASAPYIGANGNWYAGGVDTGIPAAGPPGPPGTAGTGLLILGSFDTAADLEAAYPAGPPQLGGTFLVGSPPSPDLYFWNVAAAEWESAGPFPQSLPEAPNTASQPYARDGNAQAWVLVTHDGGTF